MAGADNLIGKGFDSRTTEEQREIATKGGIASGESRRNKKSIREAIEILLETDIKDKKGGVKSGAEAIAIAQFQKALKGDTKAFVALRDTAGQKPIEKVEQLNTNIVVDLSDLDDND